MNPGGRDPVMGEGLSALATVEVGQGSPSLADNQGSPERLGRNRVSPATVQPPLLDATINEADAISKLTETLKEFGLSERTRHTQEAERDKSKLKTEISSLGMRVKQLTAELDTANKKAAATDQTLEGHGGDLPFVLDAYKAVVASQREKLHKAETERDTAVAERNTAQEHLEAITTRCEVAESRLQPVEEENRRLQDENDKLREQNDAFRTCLGALQSGPPGKRSRPGDDA